MARRESEGREQVTAVNCSMKGIGRKDAKEAYAKFKFQMTSAIRKAFEWEDIHGACEWEPEAPNDSFRCHFIELTPNAPELKGKAMNIEASTISDFQIQTKAKKDGKNAVKASKRVVDVLCTVRFTSESALAFLEAYKVGANKSSEMLISFDPAPTQSELEGTRVDVQSGEKDGEQGNLPGVAPTAAEKKAAREEERKKFAELRERAKNK